LKCSAVTDTQITAMAVQSVSHRHRRRFITFHVSRRPREMYCGHARLFVFVCLSTAACPHYCTDRDVTWGVVRDAPSCALLGGFAIGARVALLWQHYVNVWQSQRQSARPSARRTHATHEHYACQRRLASPAIKSTRLLRAPFHFVHIAGVL